MKIIKEFGVKTLIQKARSTRTVKRVLEVLTKKYAKNVRKKIFETMRKISGFKMEYNEDILLYRFNDMVTKAEPLRLMENLRYALSLQFMGILEKN